jgi:hypothetical protein
MNGRRREAPSRRLLPATHHNEVHIDAKGITVQWPPGDLEVIQAAGEAKLKRAMVLAMARLERRHG